MKETLSNYEVADRLMQANWSYEAAKALANFYEELEEQTGEEIEFDAVAIRCDWTEYSNIIGAATDSGWSPEDGDDEDDQEKDALRFLKKKTTIINLPCGGVLVQSF